MSKSHNCSHAHFASPGLCYITAIPKSCCIQNGVQRKKVSMKCIMMMQLYNFAPEPLHYSHTGDNFVRYRHLPM